MSSEVKQDERESFDAGMPLTFPKGTDNQQIAEKLMSVSQTGEGLVGINNFDGSPMERWKLASIATGPTARKGADHLGEIINLKYYYVTSVDKEDEKTGEIKRMWIVAMVDADGTVTTFVSQYLVRDVGRIVQMFGNIPFNPPIPIKVVEAKGKHKQGWYGIVPA